VSISASRTLSAARRIHVLTLMTNSAGCSLERTFSSYDENRKKRPTRFVAWSFRARCSSSSLSIIGLVCFHFTSGLTEDELSNLVHISVSASTQKSRILVDLAINHDEGICVVPGYRRKVDRCSARELISGVFISPTSSTCGFAFSIS